MMGPAATKTGSTIQTNIFTGALYLHSYFSFFLLTVLINLFHMMIFAPKSFLWEKREQAAREREQCHLLNV